MYSQSLVKVLERVIASPNEDLFRKGVQSILKSHITWMEEWVDRNEQVLSRLDQLTASVEDDFALFQIELDEWENEDRAVGMRYAALAKRYKNLMEATRRQILEEEIENNKSKINALVKKANVLARRWEKKLSKAPYDRDVANSLRWLTQLTAEELIQNYKRWEKEKL